MLLGPFAGWVHPKSVQFLRGFLDRMTIIDHPDLLPHVADPRLVLVRAIRFAGLAPRVQEPLVAGMRILGKIEALAGQACSALAGLERELPVEEIVESSVIGDPFVAIGDGPAFRRVRKLVLNASHLPETSIAPIFRHPALEEVAIDLLSWTVHYARRSGIVVAYARRAETDALVALFKLVPRKLLQRVTLRNVFFGISNRVLSEIRRATGAEVNVGDGDRDDS